MPRTTARRCQRARLAQAIAVAAAAAAAMCTAVCTPGAAPALAAPALAAPALAAPALAAPAGPVSLTWHKLTLINGWHSAQAADGTGDPAWAVSHGIVYLSGSLLQSSGSKAKFAVLPEPARPAHFLWIATDAADDTPGGIAIDASGRMREGASNEHDFLSLAGLSYPAAATAEHPLHLRAGWKLQPPAADVGAPAYTRSGNVVCLSGGLHDPAGNGLFAVLPAGQRPASVTYITVPSGGWVPVALRIEPNGRMYLVNGPVKRFVSLAGVSFSAAATGWHGLSLLNGWGSADPAYQTGAPAYRVSGGVVYLHGAVIQSGNGANLITVLPHAAWPAHPLYISDYTLGGAIGTLLVQPGGSVWIYGNPQSDAQDFTSLSGISFPLGS